MAPDQIKGVRLTHMGGRRYDADEVIERHDPHGRPYYWLGGTQADDDSDLDSDAGAVKHGYVSLTPITLDMTHYELLARMRSDGLDAQWSEHGF
ncbi:MAG: hypothetical protein IPK16_11615 [Anaerolineales bacterium]|nr:hypothetical protein [Anaerolineales bacterium]